MRPTISKIFRYLPAFWYLELQAGGVPCLALVSDSPAWHSAAVHRRRLAPKEDRSEFCVRIR
jgi:hypothetical protein